jgi:hypothetical protein
VSEGVEADRVFSLRGGGTGGVLRIPPVGFLLLFGNYHLDSFV